MEDLKQMSTESIGGFFLWRFSFAKENGIIYKFPPLDCNFN